MKKYSNIFIPGAPHHVYQITADRGILFYSEIDMLVMYSIISVLSRKFKIIIYSLCFMLNHVHLLMKVASKHLFLSFLKRCTSEMAKKYNADKSRNGKLFSPVGYAPKKDPQIFRSSNNYVINNAPEKMICKTAIEYRWDFLAYYGNSHPFSEAYVECHASKDMKRYVAIVRDYRKREITLNYDLLKNMKRKLSDKEWKQMIDIIIIEYWFLEFEETVSYYGNMDNMLLAANSNLGSEHDIHEETGSKSFLPYYRMIKEANRIYQGNEAWNPFAMTEDEKIKLANWLLDKGYGSPYQIRRLLHLPDCQ